MKCCSFNEWRVRFITLLTLSGLMGGGRQFDNTPSGFFAIIQKVFELGSSNFLDFLTNSYTPHIRLKVKPLLTNTSKEFIKCRILYFLIMECCRYLVFLIIWNSLKLFPYIHGYLFIFANTEIYVI